MYLSHGDSAEFHTRGLNQKTNPRKYDPPVIKTFTVLQTLNLIDTCMIQSIFEYIL